jgi:hypothetical protein
VLKPCYLIGLGVLGLALSAFAAAPPVESEEVKAARPLIEAMGDRDWATRERAEKKIVAMGMAALPILRKAAVHADPEVRRRAWRLLPGLEHAALVMPKRYTFNVVDQPISGVLEAMKKATGYKIENNAGTIMWPAGPDGKVPPGERKFTYRFKNATYWEIMDRLTLDTRLQVQQNWGDDIIRLYHGGTTPAYSGYDGAFRYTANNFQMYRNVDLSRPADSVPGGGRSESLTLSLTLWAEPRMPFLGVETPRLEVARDDRKGSMIPITTLSEYGDGNPWGGRFISRRYYGGGYKQPTIQVSVNLAAPSVGARRLALVKGVVPVSLLIDQKPIVVSDDIEKAKGTKKEVEGVEFHIQDYKALPNNQCQVQFTVNNKAAPGDYTFMNTIYQRLELFDGAGVKYQNYGSSWGGGPAGVMNLTLTFGHFGGKIGSPKKFVYHHWVTKTHEISFEFKDLPLP